MSELGRAFEQSESSSASSSPVKEDRGLARLRNAIGYSHGADTLKKLTGGVSSSSPQVTVDLSGLNKEKDTSGDPSISLGTIASILAVLGAIIGLITWARGKGESSPILYHRF